MLADSSSRRLLALVAIGLYWAMLFLLTHLPGDAGDERPRRKIPHLDKVAHAAAFAGLAALACLAVTAFRPVTPQVLAGVAGVLATYAAVDELTQGLIRDRTPDLRDWLADMLGMLAGIGAFLLARRALVGRLAKAPTAPVAKSSLE
jgi:VanZ family protein